MNLVCKYCEQPIYETKKSVGIAGQIIYMRGKYRHVEGDEWACEQSKVNPNNPNFQKPKCHVCGTETKKHEDFCSFSGVPPYHAKAPGE